MIAFATVLIAAMAVIGTGCATLPSSKTADAGTQQTGPAASGDVGESPESRGEVLSAVEEFLARTQDYRMSPPASAAPPRKKSEIHSKRTEADSVARAESRDTVANGDSADRAAAPPMISETSQRDAAFANTQVVLSEPAGNSPVRPIPAVEAVTIRWNDSGAEQPSPPPSKAANAPMDVRSESPSPSLERVIPELERQVEARKDLASEWRLRLAQLALERDSEAMSISPHVSEDLRELLSGVIRAAAAVRNVVRNPQSPPDEALHEARELARRLAERSDPEVATVALCRKVLTFGTYEEMGEEEFVAGRSIQTIVYSEIRRLRSREAVGKGFETKISTRIELLSGDGKSMWIREEPEIVDICRRPRLDFFIAQRVTLPPTLPAGEYVLKVSVEDKLSGKAGESSVPISIRSPVSVAKSGDLGR